MTDNARGKMYPCEYVDDAGQKWRADLTEAVRTAGGFGACSHGTAYLPKHAKMRHIGLLDSETGKRHQIPIGSIGNSNYKNGGTVNFDGKSMFVTGRIGEKFRVQ